MIAYFYNRTPPPVAILTAKTLIFRLYSTFYKRPHMLRKEYLPIMCILAGWFYRAQKVLL